MKIVPLLAALLTSVLPAVAGDHHMLIAPAGGSSPLITLAQGDTAELKFCSFNPEGIGASVGRIVVNAEGREFNMNTSLLEGGASYKLNPVKVAGPATLKFQIVGGNTAHFATVEVNRAGTASSATPIPQEPGTTWQVILEASSDLTNWTAVAPGDYASSTPQRYFRTRLVKRP
jgi:hypothetical protein